MIRVLTALDVYVDDHKDSPAVRHVKFASRDTFQELVSTHTTPVSKLTTDGNEFTIPSKAKLEVLAEENARPTTTSLNNWYFAVFVVLSHINVLVE
jgi:hypothetical protein